MTASAWSGAVGLAVLAIAACLAWVDRPAASWAHATFQGDRTLVALTHLVDPVLPCSAIGLVVIGTGMLLGWRPPAVVRTVLCMCVAVLLAVTLKDQLKYAFGRTWPETWVADNPSWIRDGIERFVPFHGGQGWASFPSGHTTLATAPMAVLMIRVRRTAWRVLSTLPILLVAVGLYGADYHFVADILAGALVGAICAALTCHALQPGEPHGAMSWPSR